MRPKPDSERPARSAFREHGAIVAVDPLQFGDLVLARKDVPASYHLAVVVDDAFEGISLVTRGDDLLPATHVQCLLQALLGLPEPAYAHHRLILDAQGRKFSKRDQAVTLESIAGTRHNTERYTPPAWSLSRRHVMGHVMSDHPIDKLFATVAARKTSGEMPRRPTPQSFFRKVWRNAPRNLAKKR